MTTYNPNYRPGGANNLSNPYYKEVNHVRLSRGSESRDYFYADYPPELDGVYPTLSLNFADGIYLTRGLDATDYTLDGVPPTLLLDFTSNTFGI